MGCRIGIASLGASSSRKGGVDVYASGLASALGAYGREHQYTVLTVSNEYDCTCATDNVSRNSFASMMHVADTPSDMEIFKQRHPLTQDGVEERAYPANCYREALIHAGLSKIREWGPYDSVINFYPTQPKEIMRKARNLMNARFGWAGTFLFRYVPAVEPWTLHALSKCDRTHGRLFTFLGVKRSLERPVF